MPASRSVGTPPLVLFGVKVEVNIAPEELESMDMDKIKAKYQEAQGAHPLTLGGAVVLHSRPDPVIASHWYSVALRSIERRYQSYSVARSSAHCSNCTAHRWHTDARLTPAHALRGRQRRVSRLVGTAQLPTAGYIRPG